MKVALVAPEWLPVPPTLGGPIEETLYETALGIQNTQMFVISRWDESLAPLADSLSDAFYHVDIEAEERWVRDRLGDAGPHPVMGGYFGYLNGVTRALHEIDPDVIQIHNRPEFVPYMLKQFPDKKVVLYMHTEAQYLVSDSHETVLNLDDFIADVTAFVFVSDYLCKAFLHRYPSARDKVHVIHNSVNTEVWHPKVKTAPETAKIKKAYGLVEGQTLLFMGRTVHEKGIHCLLEAMVYVKAYLPEVKLLVAGSPFFESVATDPFLEYLKGLARVLGESVVFTGYVPHEMTPYFYAAADVTVVPSVWEEPFGKVVTESMGVGTPVVASRCGGIPEIIDDGCDGISVDQPEDEKALSNVLYEILLCTELREKLGRCARKKMTEQFARPIRLNRVEHFYQALRKEVVIGGKQVLTVSGNHSQGGHYGCC